MQAENPENLKKPLSARVREKAIDIDLNYGLVKLSVLIKDLTVSKDQPIRK
jgi:hypothetical protein